MLFEVVPEWSLACLLIVAGVIKIIGIIKRDKKLMRAGIITLSAVWTGTFVIYTYFSFGVGYPSPFYLLIGFVVVVCYRVARKGDFY